MINFRPFLFFDQCSTLSHEFELAKFVMVPELLDYI